MHTVGYWEDHDLAYCTDMTVAKVARDPSRCN
jgi:hypothetical protein